MTYSFHNISHFEPDFTGKKSKLYILQQCIIYLKYLFLDTLPYDMKEGSVWTYPKNIGMPIYTI